MTVPHAAQPILSIQGLCTQFFVHGRIIRAVDGVDLEVLEGESLGVVGESGCGKTVTFMSVIGLVRPPGRIVEGSIRFNGRELLGMPPREMRSLRGKEIAMTMQDALTALNPAFTVGSQITEVLLTHDDEVRGAPRSAGRARERALEIMGLVGIPDADRRIDNYPHQFSGGMRQRAMLAAALACRPKLLIADEPTTALDVTIQAQVLELIADMRRQLGMSVVMITHDLGVVSQFCDRVVIMYAGQVVESGTTRDVIRSPRHPYTQGLLRSLPPLGKSDRVLESIEGTVPDPSDLPTGCRFMPRCPWRQVGCEAPIPLRLITGERTVRCLLDMN